MVDPESLRDSRGGSKGGEGRLSWGSKFFQFQTVFEKIRQNRMLAPTPPPPRVGARTSGKSWIRHWIEIFRSDSDTDTCDGICTGRRCPYLNLSGISLSEAKSTHLGRHCIVALGGSHKDIFDIDRNELYISKFSAQ